MPIRDAKKILYVSSEIQPYITENPEMAFIGRFLPQAIQERGKEIRSFMPRYGCISERRNQLHEVFRLSGIDIIINDVDRPLSIKVASVPSARMQIYFIDNEDYFHRKQIYRDVDGTFFKDNDERGIFFVRGVLETVKKLRWQPDIVHCGGWLSHLLPIYLKKAYHDDPLFANTKVVLSLYNDVTEENFNNNLKDKMLISGIEPADIESLSVPTSTNIAKLAIDYSDAVILGSPEIDTTLVSYAKSKNLPIVEYVNAMKEDSDYVAQYDNLYESLL